MAEFNEHPTEDQLLVYIDGDSSGREEIESHIALCKECAEFVSAIGQAERYARIAPRLEDTDRRRDKISIMRRIIAENVGDDLDGLRTGQAPIQPGSETKRLESPSGEASREPMYNDSLTSRNAISNNEFWTRSKGALVLAVAASLLLAFILNWPIKSSQPSSDWT